MSFSPAASASHTAPADCLLAGGGEMGARMRAHDWSSTPVGAVDTWPVSLKTAVRILLDCRLPMYIAWGPAFTQFYNDAYRPILGNKHEGALGNGAPHTWPEIWETIGPMWAEVWQGKSFGFDDFKLTIERFGYREDCYFNFSYSPVPDDDGRVAGVLVTFAETTVKVRNERRQAFQLQAAHRLRGLSDTRAVMAAAAQMLGEHLGVSRVGYGEIDGAGRKVRVERDWTDGTVGSLAGEERALDSFGPTIIDALRAGQTLALDDIAADPDAAPYAAGYASIGTRSLLVVPLIKGGRLSAILYLHQPAPHRWSEDDILLAQYVAEQTWSSLERARAEQELQENEDHYRHTVELNPDVPWTAAADGRIDRISSRWFEWTGNAGIGDDWQQALHPDDRARTVAAWKQALAGAGTLDVEARLCLRDGSHRWVHMLAYPRRAAQGRILRWYGTTRDVNDYKLALEAISKQELEFRTMAEVMPNHIWVAAADGGALWFNRRAQDYSGMAQHQLEGEGWTATVHPEDIGPIRKAWSAAMAGGQPYASEFRMRDAAGEYRWFIARALPVLDPQGAVSRWIGSNTDVHEQKSAAAQLARLNRFLEHEVEQRTADRDRMWRLSTDIMLVAKFDSTIVAVNPAWQEMLGWSETELLGRGFLELLHPDDLQATTAEAARLSQGVKTLHFENRYRHRDGSYRWLSWTAVPDASYIHAVARDITQDKEREEALRQAEQALRQAQKLESVGKLTGGVAHDFNNILQVVSGSLQLLQRHLGGNQAALQRLDTALGAVERGAKLASQLLAFARRQPLQPVVVNPGRVVRGMEELLGRVLGETIEIDTGIAADAWNTMLDPYQLENVILNLAINARDAMPGGGRLRIAVDNAVLGGGQVATEADVAPGQYILFSVSDTGTGMTPQVLEQACEPFFTTKPEGQGTGLGLSMAYGYVKQSGGHFDIESEVGKGTRIRMYFPRCLQDEAPPAPEPSAQPDMGGNETILVVEDDLPVQATVVGMLSELGYTVLKADNAQAALVILRSGIKVDLLFTDVVMPGPLRSPELAREARLMQPELAVLFTSGYTRNTIMQGARLDAGVHLISKPYRREQLGRKIRQLLHERGKD